MACRKWNYYCADFETTVYTGQTYTEVWAAAIVKLYTEDVKVFSSINEIYDYILKLKENAIIYFHNLKFDGEFWLSFFAHTLKLELAYDKKHNEWLQDNKMPPNSYKYMISDKGQWYSITIKNGSKIIRIQDSLKLLPFSVDVIGKSFGTKHRKLSIEYEGFRYAGGEIKEEEKDYISNDVLVVKEALEIMFDQGHSKITIGACCLSEFKSGYDKGDYGTFFPKTTEIKLNAEMYGYSNLYDYILKSYRGGWCYLKKGCENKIYNMGSTADVNSLYPSMMSSQSGNRYPYGKPRFFQKKLPPNCNTPTYNRYFFVRFKCYFELKKGYLPFVQIKGDPRYKGNEMLETSAIRDRNGIYHKYYEENGQQKKCIVTLTFTMTDYYLFLEHYNVEDFEIIDSCEFFASVGFFDDYMYKYKSIKETSKGAIRQLAKLFLNNLYGKMASSTDSSFKIAYEKEDGVLGYTAIEQHEKQEGYIPIGSAITSYAREFTIRHAQANYKYFIYADTDSIHCSCRAEKLNMVKIHPTEFCCWKIESTWDKGLFVRQKTYIEHVIEEDQKPIDTPYYEVKCAGMPKRCKELFLTSMGEKQLTPKTPEEQEFLRTKRTLSDFKVGLTIPSKLVPKRILGGVVLLNTTYEMRPNVYIR